MVTTFYCGSGPAFIDDRCGLLPRTEGNSSHNLSINGGTPQSSEFNMSAHLTKLRSDVQAMLPDPSYDGVAILDFESWKYAPIHLVSSIFRPSC